MKHQQGTLHEHLQQLERAKASFSATPLLPQLAAQQELLERLQQLLAGLAGCQALWLRLAPIFALPDASRHLHSDHFTFAHVRLALR